MVFKETKEDLEYILVDPTNSKQIEQTSLIEREAFATGIDPVELPEVLQFIANKGYLWLQYIKEKNEDIPIGVLEFLPLESALKYDFKNIISEEDTEKSPLIMIIKNHEMVFSDARRFADDKDITYYHGIVISRKSKGYGTLLLNHALKETPNISNTIISCFIDAAQINEKTGKLELAANESSYTLHIRGGFVLIGVVEPPLYNDTIISYSFIRASESNPLKFSSKSEKLKFDEPDVNKIIQQVKDLTSLNYVGISYNKKIHEMTFIKLHR